MRIQRKAFLPLVSPPALLVAAAYIQWGTVGLPALPFLPPFNPETAATPHGFPARLRIAHYVNYPLPYPADPRRTADPGRPPPSLRSRTLNPGTEWLRLTPIEVPKDRVWTAKDDSRYLSPWIGLPGRGQAIERPDRHDRAGVS